MISNHSDVHLAAGRGCGFALGTWGWWAGHAPPSAPLHGPEMYFQGCGNRGTLSMGGWRRGKTDWDPEAAGGRQSQKAAMKRSGHGSLRPRRRLSGQSPRRLVAPCPKVRLHCWSPGESWAASAPPDRQADRPMSTPPGKCHPFLLGAAS